MEPPDAAGSGLTGRLTRGAVRSAIGVMTCQIIILVQTIVLGRLLGPAEVGVFAAGSVASGFLLVFAQSAMAQALVARRTHIEDAANTALAATVMTGLLLSLGVLMASTTIGEVFHDPRVGVIAAATSGLLVIQSLTSVPAGLMQRALHFRQRTIIDPAAKSVFAVVAILVAARGAGAWALVIGSYAAAVTTLVLSWWLARWRPFRGRASFRMWRELAVFALPLGLSEVGERTREAFEQVLIGRGLGTADLGQYRYGYRISWILPLAVIQVCSYALFPAFARISDDCNRFRSAFLRALGWIWFAAVPVGALIAVVGEPVVVVLLGEQWRSAGAAAAAMAGVGPGIALTTVAMEAIKGAGRAPLVNWLTASNLVLGIGLVVLLLPFGLVGVGAAVSMSYLTVGVIATLLAGHVVGASHRNLSACLVRPPLSALAAFGLTTGANHLWIRTGPYDTALGVVFVACEVAVFAVVYLFSMRLLEPARTRALIHAGRRLRTMGSAAGHRE